MAGILFILFLSHFILKYTLDGSIKMLGISLGARDIKIILFALLCPILFIIILHYSISIVVDNPYKVNSNYNAKELILGIWYVIKSVVYEELIFRGALFYVVMKKFGIKTAVIASSAAFGMYHWFSFNVLGNPILMAKVFITTAFVGYCLARSFVVSKTLLLPMALHFGLNVALMIIFSLDDQLGSQLFIKSSTVDGHIPHPVVGALLLFLYYFGLPLFILIFLRFIKPRYNNLD